MSTGLGAGCDWLKNSSACNIKFNQHLSIGKKHTQKSQTGITHIAFSEELPGEDCPEAKLVRYPQSHQLAICHFYQQIVNTNR